MAAGPDGLLAHHLTEWADGSAVAPELAAANLLSISGQTVLEALAGERLAQLGGHASQYATGVQAMPAASKPTRRMVERSTSSSARMVASHSAGGGEDQRGSTGMRSKRRGEWPGTGLGPDAVEAQSFMNSQLAHPGG